MDLTLLIFLRRPRIRRNLGESHVNHFPTSVKIGPKVGHRSRRYVGRTDPSGCQVEGGPTENDLWSPRDTRRASVVLNDRRSGGRDGHKTSGKKPHLWKKEYEIKEKYFLGEMPTMNPKARVTQNRFGTQQACQKNRSRERQMKIVPVSDRNPSPSRPISTGNHFETHRETMSLLS